MNAEHDEVLNIEGPMCVCPGPCGMFDQEFKVSKTYCEACPLEQCVE